MLAPVAEAEVILKCGIGAYQVEQSRIQDEREREARAAAERPTGNLRLSGKTLGRPHAQRYVPRL